MQLLVHQNNESNYYQQKDNALDRRNDIVPPPDRVKQTRRLVYQTIQCANLKITIIKSKHT